MAKKRKISKEKQKKISKEIETLLREYKETGKMTTSRAEYRPRSLKHAQQIAAAIAYNKYGVGKAGRKKKKKK
jgi:hypothetical protein